MHRFIIKRQENGLFSIRAATFSDMTLSTFDVAEEKLNEEMEKIRSILRICYGDDTYTPQAVFDRI